MLKKKLLRIVVCCVKLQKRVNADFYKTQYFSFFKNLCKIKNLLFEKFYDKYFVFLPENK